LQELAKLVRNRDVMLGRKPSDRLELHIVEEDHDAVYPRCAVVRHCSEATPA